MLSKITLHIILSDDTIYSHEKENDESLTETNRVTANDAAGLPL
jgi:hypothetical protein